MKNLHTKCTVTVLGKFIFLLLFSIVTTFSSGQSRGDNAVVFETDTIYPLEGVVIVESPKEGRLLRNQPLSVSIVNGESLEQNRVYTLKRLNSLIPNFYAPDYGTKITSSLYIRGIGSRINSAAVGVYVDGIPYYNKSAFDFDYADVDRIDVLRGPQGTLYGLGTMGGLVSIHTRNPFAYHGTELMLSGATKNNYRISLSHYGKLSPKVALSASGFYNGLGGFYKNDFDGKKIDRQQTGGGRIHTIWRPASSLEFDLNLSYQYSDAGGFPYGEYDVLKDEVANPAFNAPSGYLRSLFSAGFVAKYSRNNFTLTSVTGFQNLKDKMKMDQDYSVENMFTLNQNQHENTLSQEITAKGHFDFESGAFSRWDYALGVSGFSQHLNIDAPMSFENDFITRLQSIMDAAMSRSPVKVILTDERMPVPGDYKTPSLGGAIFHQSIFSDILGLEGLSMTLGVRWDYQRVKIDYNTSASLAYQMFRNNVFAGEGEYTVAYIGSQKHSYSPVLPRLALKYDFACAESEGNVYAVASRGYRGGGYNIQMLGDYMSADVQRNKGTLENDETINTAITYKPEYLWNYELGSHLSFLKNRIIVDASLFYMRVKEQQVVRFADGGLGRYTSNAGKGRSRGAEVSLIIYPVDELRLTANYGYTKSEFLENSTQVSIEGELVPVDYKGKYVPFAPVNSFNAGCAYTLNLCANTTATLYADYSGLGKIYFTEQNDASQSYYSLLNAGVSFNFGTNSSIIKNVELTLWGTNLLNKKYKLFYFENSSKSFAQKGRGTQGGFDLRFRF